MSRRHRPGRAGFLSAACLLVLAAGCGNGWIRSPRVPAPIEVPEPLHLLLPQKIEMHPFTGTRVFSGAGGVTGIDVRIEAKDAYGDPAKAFGKFRFELFHHKTNSPDPKGRRVAFWNIDVEDPKVNRRHWNSTFKTYQFKLQWAQSIPIGSKFVLTAVFDSRFGGRLFHERIFTSGQ